MFLKADNYDVSGSGNNWVATVWQGHNVIDVISAVSEKQAHFLAQTYYPEAKTPQEYSKMKDREYYSKEGFAYRAKANNK